MKTFLFFTILFYSCIVQAQTNYYVSASGGNNANAGTLAKPWGTIQYGLNHMLAGDTLNVLNGTYTEKLKVPVSGITLRNYTGHAPVIDANGITSQKAIIEIVNVSTVRVKGLELKNSIMKDAQGILVDGNCQHISIQNCVLHDIHFSSNAGAAVNANTNAQGIIVYGSNATTAMTDINILNNQLYNCRLGYSEGIAVNGNVDGFVISGNLVHDLTNIGIDIIGHEGTSSNAANDQARNGIATYNIVHHCVSAYATSAGLYIDGGNNIIVEHNTSYHNGYGIEVGCENKGKTTDGIIIRDNVFYDNEICAIALGGFDYPAGSGKVINSSIRNNTCYYNDYSKSGTGELYLSYSENSVIENNIFYLSTQNRLVYAELTQPSLAFNYNIFYCVAGAASFFADWNGKSYSSFSSFVTGSATNANASFANPLFVSAGITNSDFHIGSTSPAVNAGNAAFVAASGETDMDGQGRTSGKVDCGADEYYLITAVVNAVDAGHTFSIYPNPSVDYCTIVSGTNDIRYIIVYDRAGTKIAAYVFEKELQISVQEYASGLYYIVGLDEHQLPVCTKTILVK
ncbi:MAG: right-handed parallel beta-helix repeat-containing protein [Cytophagales bacterium]|nr:right-handed parallel beta-helix repeat-containing protein [Cytophaga sp.]